MLSSWKNMMSLFWFSSFSTQVLTTNHSDCHLFWICSLWHWEGASGHRAMNQPCPHLKNSRMKSRWEQAQLKPPQEKPPQGPLANGMAGIRGTRNWWLSLEIQIMKKQYARVLGRILGLWKGQVWGTSLHRTEVVLFARNAGRVKRQTQYRVGPFGLDESKNCLKWQQSLGQSESQYGVVEALWGRGSYGQNFWVHELTVMAQIEKVEETCVQEGWWLV